MEKILDSLISLENDAIQYISYTIFEHFKENSTGHITKFTKTSKIDLLPEHDKFLLDCSTLFLGYMLDSDLFADIPSNCDDSGAFSENGFEQSRVIWEIEGETSKRNRKIVSVPICSQFNPNSSLLSSDVPFFLELGYMLDLCNHDKICRLLPYLLTAYVCHANKNSFAKRGSYDIIFGLQHRIGEQNVTRRKSQFDKLAHMFSLKDITICEPPKPKELDPRKPVAAYADRSSVANLYHDRTFINHIFATWSATLLDVCLSEQNQEKLEIQTIYKKMSLKDSYLLFLYYTKQEFPVHYQLNIDASNEEYIKKLYPRFSSTRLSLL